MALSLRPARAAVLVLAAALGLSSCNTSTPAATVGGQKITDGQLELAIRLARFVSGPSGSQCGTSIRKAGERIDAACARQELQSLIDSVAIRAFAQAHHITLSSADVNRALATIQVRRAELVARLRAQHLTLAEFRALVRRSLLFGQVVAATLGRAATSSVVQRWLLRQLVAEGVQVNPRYGRFDPSTGGVDRISSTATQP